MRLEALTTFYLGDGVMWLQGQVREVSEHQGRELMKVKLVALVPEPAPVAPEPEKEAPQPKKRERKPKSPVTETK